jgi:hypothetical protein
MQSAFCLTENISTKEKQDGIQSSNAACTYLEDDLDKAKKKKKEIGKLPH